jgi:hypothetical protein
MGWKGALRAAEAARRKKEREQVQRLRDLERRTKEQAKLSALEQARLEVQTHEARIELLLSIHREPIEAWNWHEVVAALDPLRPAQLPINELPAKLMACAEARVLATGALEGRRAEDLRALGQALSEYAANQELRKAERTTAARVVRSDVDAWVIAIPQFMPFDELEQLGVKVTSEFYSPGAVHCRIVVSGPEIIPHEAKTLTSTGKLSAKPMAKSRFHEIYQDYVCGCVLRTASDMVGFLPVDVILVTASVGFVDPATGQFGIRPVISVGFTRSALSQLELAKVDPSDAIESFIHRGDAKASRKTGAFAEIEPLRLEDVAHSPTRSVRFDSALEGLRRERDQIRAQAAPLATRLRSNHHPLSPEA